MRRINLPLILDTLFAALCAFLLFFTSIRYYTKNAFVALGFAIVACLLFGSLSFLYISKKQNKHFLKVLNMLVLAIELVMFAML